MSFLSIDQRKAGSVQLREHLRLVEADIAALRLAEGNLEEYRRIIRSDIERVERSIRGETADADELHETDTRTRERMLAGIHHYPVRVSTADRVTIAARWP